MDKNYYQDEEFTEFEEFEELEEFEESEDEDEDEEEAWKRSHRSEDKPAKSHRGRKLAVVIFILLVGAFTGIVYGFKLEDVRIIGNKTYSEDEVKALMNFPENMPNTLLCYLKYFRYKAEDVPFLEKIQVKIENRNMICIEVFETNIIGCLRQGKSYCYFDDSGIIQEILSDRKDTVAVIEGISLENMEIGQKISIENETTYKGIIELCQLLIDHNIKAQKIEIDKNGKFTVYIDDNIRVGFGTPVLLEEKAVEMANILPELQSMAETEQIKGILHLENYDSTKNSIVFTKEN
ncbi:MAG: hypothetical protein SO181_06400 [Frisingicoccus sp.]|uniref:cell division protein FtsQ/DivIB n=1 Tax=Frisingicoccus sp. TaxID=1918627 RepID=UPI002A7FF2D3|nr:hypothetical protein [Frisingicoccus sp.]MDY4834761.1 hypothetical protein [Frisingicoccus sp.]